MLDARFSYLAYIFAKGYTRCSADCLR